MEALGALALLIIIVVAIYKIADYLTKRPIR